MRRWGPVVLGLLVAIGWPTRAQGQSWNHPPLVDYDQAAEEFSAFWDTILNVEKVEYRKLVEHAHDLWKADGPAEKARALLELEKATQLLPTEPEAFFWLGMARAQSQDWQACIGALQSAFGMQPSWSPPMGRSDVLEYNLAICLLRSGEYDTAIRHFRRILSLGNAEVAVDIRLGEALMAIGHLEEAIFTLERAVKRTTGHYAQIALAVAFDRDGQSARSQSLLARVLRRDQGLRFLQASSHFFLPNGDEHYYLGLAYVGLKQPMRARYHFRQYQYLAPQSPWSERIRSHLARLPHGTVGEDLAESAIRWNRDVFLRAVAKREVALRGCLHGYPLLWAQVVISGVVGNDNTEVQIRVKGLRASRDGTDPEKCLKRVASGIVLPPVQGPAGGHATAMFGVASMD